MKFIFFDISQTKVNDYQTYITFNNKTIQTDFVCIDFNDLIKKYRISCIVSPANSLGFMDGGIDAVFMKWFPGIQKTVQGKIKEHNLKTALGRYCLPVGSAQIVGTNSRFCPLLISAPTMFLPEDIRETRNAYYAFLAILFVLKRWMTYDNIVIAVPGLGTGIGKLSGKKFGAQVQQAFEDFFNKTFQEIYKDPEIKLLAHETDRFVLNKIPCDQPKNYANTEIINIAINPNHQKLI